MSFCTKCGSELKEGAKFCTGCGQPSDTSQTQTTENNQINQPIINKNVNKMEENTNQNNQGVDFKSMPKSAIVIAVICGVGIIGTFLPWVTVSFLGYSSSVSGISGTWGWLTLIGFAGAAGSVLFGKQMGVTESLGKQLPLYTGGAATLFCVISLIRVLSNSGGYGELGGVGLGFGLIISLVAGVALLLVGLNVIKIK